MIADRIDSGYTTLSKILVGIAMGWMACAAVHQTATSDKAAAAIPVLQAEAGCEHWLGRKATTVAKQAIVAANSDVVPVPDVKIIPKDNCAKVGVLQAEHGAAK